MPVVHIFGYSPLSRIWLNSLVSDGRRVSLHSRNNSFTMPSHPGARSRFSFRISRITSVSVNGASSSWNVLSTKSPSSAFTRSLCSDSHGPHLHMISAYNMSAIVLSSCVINGKPSTHPVHESTTSNIYLKPSGVVRKWPSISMCNLETVPIPEVG